MCCNIFLISLLATDFFFSLSICDVRFASALDKSNLEIFFGIYISSLNSKEKKNSGDIRQKRRNEQQSQDHKFRN